MSADEFRLQYDPRLVEEAVLRAIVGCSEEPQFRQERNRVYEVAPEQREGGFQQVHATWFAALGLNRPFEQAFAERAELKTAVARCLVVPARGKKDEGAELFVDARTQKGAERAGRAIGIQLRSESLIHSEALLCFLRHELLHIADMLDPRFGYDPVLPPVEGGGMAWRLLQDRYRALWDTTIDGRLVRLGWVPPTVRRRRMADFARAFPMWGEAEFARFFDELLPTHAELVAWATAPQQMGDRHCPLCGFPTRTFVSAETLAPAIFSHIQRSFPRWQPDQGLCRQCADLYQVQGYPIR